MEELRDRTLFFFVLFFISEFHILTHVKQQLVVVVYICEMSKVGFISYFPPKDDAEKRIKSKSS